jgi:hypothetical protein
MPLHLRLSGALAQSYHCPTAALFLGDSPHAERQAAAIGAGLLAEMPQHMRDHFARADFAAGDLVAMDPIRALRRLVAFVLAAARSVCKCRCARASVAINGTSAVAVPVACPPSWCVKRPPQRCLLPFSRCSPEAVGASDLSLNAPWLRAIVKLYPSTTPTAFLLADGFVALLDRAGPAPRWLSRHERQHAREAASASGNVADRCSSRGSLSPSPSPPLARSVGLGLSQRPAVSCSRLLVLLVALQAPS